MIAIIAQTYIGEAKLPAVTHRFLGATYKEARNIFKLHRRHDAMLQATTGQKDSTGERGADPQRAVPGAKNGGDSTSSFQGIPMRTVFRVQRIEDGKNE